MRDGRRATGEGLRGGGVVLSVPGGFTLVCRAAVGFLDRARGLLGTLPGRPLENALLLPDCPSVHTCGMAYPIDHERALVPQDHRDTDVDAGD